MSNADLIHRCKKRLEDGTTVWCDWEKDVPKLVQALIDAETTRPPALHESLQSFTDAVAEELTEVRNRIVRQWSNRQ